MVKNLLFLDDFYSFCKKYTSILNFAETYNILNLHLEHLISQLNHNSPAPAHLLSCADCCIEKDDIWLDFTVFDVGPQLHRAQCSKNGRVVVGCYRHVAYLGSIQ